jgi:hypothetical protein
LRRSVTYTRLKNTADDCGSLQIRYLPGSLYALRRHGFGAAHRASAIGRFLLARRLRLAREIPYLAGAETVQLESHTLTCRVERGGPVLASFFGNLNLGEAAPREEVQGSKLHVASLLDIAGTKALTVQQRAQPRDYTDIDELIRHGIELPRVLAAGAVVYGRSFNPLIILKALSYFDDVPTLPGDVRERLRAAVEAVDPTRLPVLTPHVRRENGRAAWNRCRRHPSCYRSRAALFGSRNRRARSPPRYNFSRMSWSSARSRT